MGFNNFIKIIFRGISQVMLQNNVLTGILFLIGIFINSWLLGLGALLGVLISTATAYLLKYKKKDIDLGYYGANGTLVGIGMFFFFKVTILLVVLTILAAALSSLIMNFMHERKLYPYTFPFILSAWIFMVVISLSKIVPWQTPAAIQASSLTIWPALTLGFGQVMFQASIITGIFFFVGILVNSRIAALYALLGSVLGILIAYAVSFPVNMINLGLFGFNGVLCGIAFAEKKWQSFIFAVISIILSVFIMFGMTSVSWIALTAPFVFATWITLGIRKLLIPKQKKKSKRRHKRN